MMAVEVLFADYEESDDTPLLEDVYMELANEVWPEIDTDHETDDT